MTFSYKELLGLQAGFRLLKDNLTILAASDAETVKKQYLATIEQCCELERVLSRVVDRAMFRRVQ